MSPDRPLADLKVLDLMWAIAGPTVTRSLADYGATVVRVETARRVDVCRTIGPFLTLPPDTEDSALFHNMNVGKHMLTLDVSTSEGRAVVLDLVRWADVVAEAFAPGVMGARGLAYDTLREVNPAIILLSTCLMGQTGPLASFAGFGNLAAAVVGFTHLCGWPDRSPAGPFGAYTDYIAPRFTVAAILAALDHRRRTGEGQWIDLSQAEASLQFLAPAVLDYTVNGRVQTRVGNRDPDAAPHGVYPVAGEDRWVALAVRSDDQWAALCAVMQRPDLAADARFATCAGRQQWHDDLDVEIAAWTAGREAQDVEAALQGVGIPASVVQDSADLSRDAQLLHREHFVRLAHPIRGHTTVENSRFRLSRTPARIADRAPTLGCDNQYVLESILGYDEQRITELAVSGALG
jgi:crotonobetainyl-CoA:carnitine CoA-transferase CaiB-like acyl-CoA transferase